MEVERPTNQVFEVKVAWQPSGSRSKPVRLQRTLNRVWDQCTTLASHPQFLKICSISKEPPTETEALDMEQGSDEASPLLNPELPDVVPKPLRKDQDPVEVPPHCPASGLPQWTCDHCRANQNLLKAAVNGVVRAILIT